MSFVLVVRMNVKEGLEEEAAATARELAAATRTEPGCEAYVPCRDPENPRSILIYEQYRDQAAREAHAASEHFKKYAVGCLYQRMLARETENLHALA